MVSFVVIVLLRRGAEGSSYRTCYIVEYLGFFGVAGTDTGLKHKGEICERFIHFFFFLL